MDSETAKILVVTGEELTPGLGEYALKMAQRLDLEVVILFWKGQDGAGRPEERRRAIRAFEGQIESVAARFSAQAWEMGVRVVTVVDVDDRDRAVSEICAQEPAIRFILSENTGTGDGKEQKYQLQVIRAEKEGAADQ